MWSVSAKAPSWSRPQGDRVSTRVETPPVGVFDGKVIEEKPVAPMGTGFSFRQNYALFVFKSNNRLGMIIGDGSTWNEVDGVTDLGTSTWIHVAGVRSPNALTLYVNGIFEAETATTITQSTNPAPLRIGGQSCGRPGRFLSA